MREQPREELSIDEQALTDDDRVAAGPKVDIELLHQWPGLAGGAGVRARSIKAL